MKRRSLDLLDFAFIDRYREALAHLLEAQAFASSLECSNDEFASQISCLQNAGIRESALRALFHQGLIKHLSETTGPDQKRRTFRNETTARFTDSSCFILTSKGIVLAESLSEQAGPRPAAEPSAQNIRPRYDADRRTLFFCGRIVKCFHIPAKNQELVLLAFEEMSWPLHIDDPIPVAGGIDRRRRLQDTLFKLNRNQHNSLLHFEANGKGTGIRWRRIDV